MVVDIEDFRKLGLERIIKKEFLQLFHFFSNQIITKNCSKDVILKLATETKSEFISNQKIICKDTKLSKYVYFVLKGNVQIHRFVQLNNCPTFKSAINQKTKIKF